MKKILLLIATFFCLNSSYSNNFYFAWDGLGMSAKYNYNLSHCYGAYYYHGVANGLGFGAQEFYQTYQLNYGREYRSTVGNALSAKVTYRFFSPMVIFQTVRTGQTQLYVTAGIGELQSQSEATLTKWSNVSWSGRDAYDSSIDLSASLKKYVFRMGLGYTQFMKLGGNFHLFISEDIGFLTHPMMDLTGQNFGAVKTNVAQFYQPTFICVRAAIGIITRSKNKPSPWRIYAGKDDDQNYY